MKTSYFGADFFKVFSLEHHKKKEWKIKVGRDSNKKYWKCYVTATNYQCKKEAIKNWMEDQSL